MSQPDKRLALARRHLDTYDPGDTLVGDAALSDAIRAAYYATFGALCEQWAAVFGQTGQRETTRMLNHSPVSKVCAKVANTGTLVEGSACPDRLREFGSAFPQLLESRHKADYDLTATFDAGDAQGLVDNADRAISALRKTAEDQPGKLRLFLAECAGAQRSSLPKTTRRLSPRNKGDEQDDTSQVQGIFEEVATTHGDLLARLADA